MSGAPFTVNLYVPSQDVHVTHGKDKLKIHHTKHGVIGSDLDLYFCGECSSNVWKNPKVDPKVDNPNVNKVDMFMIQTGCLDRTGGAPALGPDVLPPRAEAFLEHKATWIPEFSGLYKMELPKEWSERAVALLG